MNHISLQKHEPIHINTKSLNQYPNIKSHTSDEIQPIEIYVNNIVVFNDMLLSKQESNMDLFFTRGRHQNFDFCYISHSYFHVPKNTLRKNSNTLILLRQTLRDIILLSLDIAELDINLQEWKQVCREAGENK